MTRKKGRKIAPEWLLTLPPGVYTMSQLIKITGLTSCAISRQLIKHGCKINKKPWGSNLIYYEYIWEGLK